MGVMTWMVHLSISILQGLTETCESLKTDFQGDAGIYVLSSDPPVLDTKIEGVSMVRIGSFDVPFPDLPIEEIVYFMRGDTLGLIAIKFEPDGHTMTISRNEVPTHMLEDGHSYFGLLAHAYSMTPDDLNCGGDEQTLKRDMIALLLKGLQLPFSSDASKEQVYMKHWGILRTGGVESSGDQTWVATYIQAYNVSLEFRWSMSTQFQSIGLATLKGQGEQASDAIEEIAACIEQWTDTCFQELKHTPVRDFDSFQDT